MHLRCLFVAEFLRDDFSEVETETVGDLLAEFDMRRTAENLDIRHLPQERRSIASTSTAECWTSLSDEYIWNKMLPTGASSMSRSRVLTGEFRSIRERPQLDI